MKRVYFKLKACPRCGGDILFDRAYEDDELCIQCGFRKYREVKYPAHRKNLAETIDFKVTEKPAAGA